MSERANNYHASRARFHRLLEKKAAGPIVRTRRWCASLRDCLLYLRED